MARTHKDRHSWKRSERKRTGSDDPKKIKLHRERFVAAIKRRAQTVSPPHLPGQYKNLVFRTRLYFDQEDQQTSIIIGEQEIEIPFLVENLEDCHYAIFEANPDFDPRREKEILHAHTSRAKFGKHPCHLEVLVEAVPLCSSVIPCKYRRWDVEKGEALCSLSHD